MADPALGRLTRRDILMLLAAAGFGPAHAETGPIPLRDQAQGLAARPYVPPSGVLPPPFAGLDYNAYRGIRPKAGQAAMLPQGPGFAVDLLPPGLYFPDPVTIERETAGGLTRQSFAPGLFDFQDRYFDAIPEAAPGAGFSGLRLRHPLNRPDILDEVAVFQGASYFRAIGQAMVYGLSARALALGTGGPQPEEFPRFTHLRLYQGQGDHIRLEAVIDSPSLAGHLDMTLIPGPETVMEIETTVFPRREIADIGIAPLTSMYLKGPMHGAASDDFRPRVHDSDVLVIENGAGEHLWRPLGNPARIETSAFVDTGPRRFGLVQTPRDYAAFEDSEARYQDRPSATVTPLGDWGAGAVTLVEIPTGTEFLDNIVAFWRPAAPLMPGGSYGYRYRLTWTTQPPEMGPPCVIRQSRSGREHELPGVRRYVIDFAGASEGLRPDLTWDGEGPEAAFGVSLFALPAGLGQRATFLLEPGPTDAIELRLVLRDASDAVVSPVWLHRWTRKPDGGV